MTFIQHLRNQSNRILLPIMMTVLLISGCDRSMPADLIEEDQYIDILVELHLLAAIKEMTGDEKKYYKGQELVLDQYQITRDQFERSHEYYLRQADKQQERFREVRNRLEKVNADLSNHYQELQKFEKSRSWENSGVKKIKAM